MFMGASLAGEATAHAAERVVRRILPKGGPIGEKDAAVAQALLHDLSRRRTGSGCRGGADDSRQEEREEG